MGKNTRLPGHCHWSLGHKAALQKSKPFAAGGAIELRFTNPLCKDVISVDLRVVQQQQQK
jgi:hypothetical protein